LFVTDKLGSVTVYDNVLLYSVIPGVHNSFALTLLRSFYLPQVTKRQSEH